MIKGGDEDMQKEKMKQSIILGIVVLLIGTSVASGYPYMLVKCKAASESSVGTDWLSNRIINDNLQRCIEYHRQVIAEEEHYQQLMEEEYLRQRDTLWRYPDNLLDHPFISHTDYTSETIIEKRVPKPRPLPTGNTLYVGGIGPGNYTKIQDAINDAVDGDTVFVYDDSSPYYENVLVNKSIYLIGENKDTTVINGGGTVEVIFVSSDWVTISGFTVQNSDYFLGIRLYYSNNNTITGNSGLGIRILHSSETIIMENTFNKYGILIFGFELAYWNTHTIKNNTLDEKPIRYYKNSNDIIVPKNTTQLILANCSDSTIKNINFSSAMPIQLGFSSNIFISSNIITNSADVGIFIWSSSNNIISGNAMNDGYEGLCLAYFSNNNTLTGNSASNNGIGIHLWLSSDNSITANKVANNRYGIVLSSGCSNNTITYNNASNNNYDGITISSESNNNTISDNSIYKNNITGIMVYNSRFNKIINNKCILNRIDGIGLVRGSSANIIENNICLDNMKGIAVRDSSSNILINNTCHYNRQGILLNNANNTWIENNNCSHDNIGIYLYQSNKNSVVQNLCDNSVFDGIALEESYFNTVTNNFLVRLNWVGLYIGKSFENKIIDNEIWDSIYAGIVLMYTSNNTINENNIYKNWKYSLVGISQLDDARYNWWGSWSPRFIGRNKIFCVWAQLFPWKLVKIDTTAILKDANEHQSAGFNTLRTLAFIK